MINNNENFNEILDNCDLDSCSTDEKKDENEEAQTFVQELQKTLLAPIISGVYITRMDIKVIAKEYGESLAIDERKKMLKQLFKYVDSVENMEKLFNIIKSNINDKQKVYQSLVDSFPHSQSTFSEYMDKSNQILSRLDQLLDETKAEDLEIV